MYDDDRERTPLGIGGIGHLAGDELFLRSYTPNIPLLRKVLEHIEEHPNEWWQSCWAKKIDCGTAYCFAGHALVMSGHTIEPLSDSNWPGEYRLDGVLDRYGDRIRQVATQELGLSPTAANELFAPFNSVTRLRSLVQLFAQMAGEEL